MPEIRKIIHIDMDAFYASVEQREHPEYTGKPVVVGGISERGVVAAASYEARAFGIYSAMPVKTALKKCRDLIIIPPDFELYGKVSEQIRNIFLEYTDLVEPLSLDEAFLDVTQNKKNNESATLLAKSIKSHIRNETGLIASAGVSFNKFLAKIASDINKPDGLFVITPEMALDFLNDLPIHKFFGIGNVTANKMLQLGIKNGEDLRKKDLPFLIRNFGKNGQYFYEMVRAEDYRPVTPGKIRKSLGVERTFEKDLINEAEIFLEIKLLAKELHQRMIKNGYHGKTLTLKIRFASFKLMTRSKSMGSAIEDDQLIQSLAISLYSQEIINEKGIRLLGISISNRESNDRAQLKIPY